jgi:hypothetical protein
MRSIEPGIWRFSGAQLRTCGLRFAYPGNDDSNYTGLIVTLSPSRGFGIGHICQSDL